MIQAPSMTKGDAPAEAAAAQARPHRAHARMGGWGGTRFVIWFAFELLANLPSLLALRKWYRAYKRKQGPVAEPMVAWVGDNLDEVNGIALSSRILLRKLRSMGKQVFLFGVAFNTKTPRSEGPDGSVILAPGRFSLDQAGYRESEVAVIRLAHFIRFIRKYPVDLIEFQTPGTVSVLCLLGAKLVGIRTLSHYRTDILTYSKLLVHNRPGVWIVNTWTKVVTRLMGPVVVPSDAYRQKVEEMGLAAGRIYKMPRGVDLESFHPGKAAQGAWRELGLPEDGVRLLYVGRISREKNLALLEEIVPGLLEAQPELSFTFVGEGPYRSKLQARLPVTSRIRFTGVVQGEKLASLFASADVFVFPSLTDTFGNSVVEALASGVPCITSDLGGPREIIVDGECGLVFDHRRPGDLAEKILRLSRDPETLRAFKAKARERALLFTYEHAARSFWDFYTRYHQNLL